MTAVAPRDATAALSTSGHATTALSSDGRPHSTSGRHHSPPCFIALASLASCVLMIVEMHANGWAFQPLTCPEADADDSTPCESNLMIGPRATVLDDLGAKNDVAILEHHAWWRLLTCTFLHAGLVHLALNLTALWSVGLGVERALGSVRFGCLFVGSSLVGAVSSALLLPGTLSVGASGGVYGCVGAQWADVLLNYWAIGGCRQLRESGALALLLATLPGILVGLTPWVDQFMHLGGLLAGVCISLCMLPQISAELSDRDARHTQQPRATMPARVAPVAPVPASPLDNEAPLRVGGAGDDGLGVLAERPAGARHSGCQHRAEAWPAGGSRHRPLLDGGV